MAGETLPAWPVEGRSEGVAQGHAHATDTGGWAGRQRGAGVGRRRQRDEEMREGVIQPNTEGEGSESWEKGQRCAQYRSVLEEVSNVNS